MMNTNEALTNTGRSQVLWVFTVASLAAVLSGSAALAASKVPVGSWCRNPVAWLIGAVVGLGLMRARRLLPVAKVILAVALFSVAGTFLAPAQAGVHRWIDMGPLHVNVAALVLPPGIIGLAFCGIWTLAGLAFVLAMAALLILQPDASQATSFLVAVVVLFARSTGGRQVARLTAMAAVILVAAFAWTRPDPLLPVAEVEGVFSLAFAVSRALGAVAALALAAASFAPFAIRAAAGAAHRTAAVALTGYFVTAAICPAIGAFPVPLVGLGMSFPVGYWLGLALLLAKGPLPHGVEVEPN
jgi:cell division protein FtsW (lipid II flippase)